MPRRTKACATCRQKRIKCDATEPHCLMCLRFKRVCPGVTDAPLLFIDNSSYPSGKKPRKSKARHDPDAGATVARYKRGVYEVEGGEVEEWEVDDVGRGGLPEELAYVMLVHVSPRHVLHEAFYANLVGYFCAEGRHIPGSVRRTPSWLHAFPRIASTSSASAGEAHGLSLALRATTSAFSGLETRNAALVNYAYGLYGAALRSQGRVLQTKGAKGMGLETVATSITLSLFEAVLATTGRAYAEHVVGAAKMLDALGLFRAKSGSGARDAKAADGGTGGVGLLGDMYWHIRIQLLYVYLTSSPGTIRDDPCITSVLLNASGFPNDKLPLQQKLIGSVARIAQLHFRTEPDHTGPGSGEVVVKQCQEMEDEFEALWREFLAGTKGQRLTWRCERTGHTDFRDPFSALNFAYFSAGRILLAVIQSRLTTIPSSPTSSPCSSNEPRTPSLAASPSSSSSSTNAAPSEPPYASGSSSSITDHFALILDVAWFLRLRDVGFAYLRLAAPLFLAAMYAPWEEQRRVARMILGEWVGGVLRGVGGLAMERVGVGSPMMRVVEVVEVGGRGKVKGEER